MANLLAPSATPLTRAVATVAADAVAFPLPVRDAWNPNTIGAPLLPWLGWSLAVDEWDAGWDEETRRQAIRDAISLHRRRGTPWAVLRALSNLGYAGSKLIEYRQYQQEWSEAGGRTLDGTWRTDGTATLNPPAGAGDIRRLALNHWAEFAIRLNIGEGAWNRDQQRTIRRIASSYAPARSHLKGLLTRATLSFDAGVRLIESRQRGRTRFDRCKRLTAHRWHTLDGCWLLDDGFTSSKVDGSWRLEGARRLSGTTPAGAPLDSGYGSFAAQGRSTYAVQAAGGDRITPPIPLVPSPILAGALRLDGRKLDARWHVDGSASLDFPTLNTLGARRLDGTWHLGRVPGRAGVWFSATAAVRRGGVVTREVL